MVTQIEILVVGSQVLDRPWLEKTPEHNSVTWKKKQRYKITSKDKTNKKKN